MGCFNSKEEKDYNGSKGPDSTQGSTKKTNFMYDVGHARGYSPSPGIMDSSKGGKKKDLTDHAGHGTMYVSKGPN